MKPENSNNIDHIIKDKMRHFFKILFTVHPALKFVISCFCFLLLIGNYSLLIETGNWYQQFMPNINGRSITDVFFLDSLNGWAVTNAKNQNPDTMFVLKTTDSGNTWAIQYRKTFTGGGFSGYFRVYFLNQNTGYTCDIMGADKSTDGGASWVSLNAPPNAYVDMSVINENRIWVVSSSSFITGGVYNTTNGGVNWTQQLSLGSQNPDHIYMYNSRIGFTAEYGGTYLRKTTDSGNIWFVVDSGGFNGFSDMYFVDSLTGWRAISFMKKTTDGGISWITQSLPNGGQIITSNIGRFSVLNKDTIWGVGGEIIVGSSVKGMIYRTTNSGQIWQFQVPDTSINLGIYKFIQFKTTKIGWAYHYAIGGIHTTTGGDTGWVLGIKQISSQIPKEFKLNQNYPNPFNPKTNIKYSIPSDSKGGFSNVQLKVFDILGREVITLVNQNQNAGTYEVDFSGRDYSSGIYFYLLIVENELIETRKMILIK